MASAAALAILAWVVANGPPLLGAPLILWPAGALGFSPVALAL